MGRQAGHHGGMGVGGMLSGLLGIGVMMTAVVFVSFASWSSAAPSVGLEERQEGFHWVDTWTSMPQLVEPNNMPPSPFSGGATFRDATLRQTLHMSLGGDRIRLQISNTFGGADLTVTAASIALPAGGKAGVGGIEADTLAGLTFDGGKPGITIRRGQVAYTDPINYRIKAQQNIAVSLYFQSGHMTSSITGHPGSRTTSWMQSGNHVNSTTVTGGNTKHWYYLSGVEVWAPEDYSALIILGDSITDGRGSEDDKNNRWPDLLLANMIKANLTKIGVNNQAAGGNAVLSGGLGPTLMTRYKRDAIEQAGVKYVLIFEGVNDIGNAPNDQGTQNRLADNLINAFKTIAADCKKAGYTVFGATITPFNGNGQSYSGAAREAARVKVNNWIMSSGGVLDGAIDFAKFVGNGQSLKPAFDGGDHLHPNVAGYQAIADQFPLDIFK